MYGPWLRVDRPKRSKDQCKFVGKSPGTPGGEPKRRSWKDLMREKQDREGSKTPPSTKTAEKAGDRGEEGG